MEENYTLVKKDLEFGMITFIDRSVDDERPLIELRLFDRRELVVSFESYALLDIFRKYDIEITDCGEFIYNKDYKFNKASEESELLYSIYGIMDRYTIFANGKDNKDIGIYLTHSYLITGFNLLIDNILGTGYYNYGCDTCSCDIFTIKDLLYKYKNQKNTIHNLCIVLIIFAVIIVGLIISVIRLR